MKKNLVGGFTLIETLVAVSILTFAVAGPLFSADRAIVAAITARDQLTASYLAQEGVEYVRAMRDNVYLHDLSAGVISAAWIDFLNTSGANVAGNIGICRGVDCTLDPTLSMDIALHRCIGACGNLNLAVTNIYTQQTGGTPTPFVRTIQIVDASPGGITDVRVVSKVSWTYHSTPYSVTVTDHLTPWQ